jgi:hypothetical protein
VQFRGVGRYLRRVRTGKSGLEILILVLYVIAFPAVVANSAYRHLRIS